MWQEKDNKLICDLTFKDFKEAIAFIVQVSLLAEKHNHHPVMHNLYNTVSLELCTHDLGNTISNKDLLLAKEIESII